MRPVLLLLLLSVGVGACSGSQEPPRNVASSVAPVMAQNKSVVDVPNLLGLDIDELSRRVGPRRPVPAVYLDPILMPAAKSNETLDSTLFFQPRGLAMQASFDYHTRRVSNLLLFGSSEEQLMRDANLQMGTDRYLLLPVFRQERPTAVLGLRVIAMDGSGEKAPK